MGLQNTVMAFMAIGAILLGSAAVFVGYSALKYGSQTSNWPTVNGTVTQSHIATISGQKGESWAPIVQFSYSVNGMEYYNGSYSLIEVGMMSQGAAQAVLNRYPVGASVTAYYDPSNPAAAVISTTSTNTLGLIFLGVGLLFLLLGLGMLYKSLTSQRG